METGGIQPTFFREEFLENSFAGAAVFCVLWGQRTNLLTLIFSNLAARLSTHCSPFSPLRKCKCVCEGVILDKLKTKQRE